MKEVVGIECYENLANAVIKKAVQDYRSALVGQHKAKSDQTKEFYERIIRECERFFTGDLFRVYTKLDGKTLMHLVRDELIECNYDLRKLTKLHGNVMSIIPD